MSKNTNKTNSKSADKITIEGVITPVDWDEDNNIIAVSISTPDEEEYIVKEGLLGDELFDLVHEYVEVSGLLDRNEYGEKYIVVDSYKLIEGNPFA